MGKRKADGEDTPKSSKKDKKVKDDEEADETVPPGVKSYEERLQALSPISTPLADEKLTKKLHKLVKKASAAKVRRRSRARAPRRAPSTRARAPQALRRGVKEVVKAIRKGAGGLCIIAGAPPRPSRPPRARPSERDPAPNAGDISPIDVICHLPIFCEEKSVPYIYVPSKQDLGFAALTKRPTSCVMVSPKPGTTFEHQDLLDKALGLISGASKE